MSGTLYLVATPIGNLQDITLRAIDVLKSVDMILAEDTRVTVKLLRHFEFEKKLISYSEYSSEEKNAKILAELAQGTNYALVSDAGTPGVSDPGAVLVAMARAQEIPVVPVAGASAVTALMSVFGERSPFFHFWGFWPLKNKKRKQLLQYFQEVPGTHVFFESPYRILKTLKNDFLPLPGRMLVGRELTKKFESFYGGTAAEVLAQLTNSAVKGEFVIGYCHSAAEATDTEEGGDDA